MTSFSRESFPERLWSIFRWAIERTSSRRTASSDGRSRSLSSNWHDEALAARLRGHHRGLRAGDELAGICGVLRPDRDSGRAVSLPTASASSFASSLADALAQRDRALHVSGRDDDGELLAADAADHVRRADGRAQDVGDLVEQLVADAVTVDVVHLLEVVEVEHHEGDGVVCGGCAQELLPKAVVERPVVVEAGQRVRLGLVLEPRANVGVVEREGGGVPEPLGEEELLVGEGRVLADAVDVERPLEAATRDRAAPR